MPSFTFRLPSREDIRSSPNGRLMLSAIDDNHPEKTNLITGCPGSGKTTVAIMRLKRLYYEAKERGEENPKLLMLTFQNMLRIALQNLAGTERIPRNNIQILHQWYADVNDRDWLSKDNEQEIIDKLKKRSIYKEELIIDEGQDFEKKIYNSLPNFFNKITVGADDSQQVHTDKGATVKEIKKSLYNFGKIKDFLLDYNYRNTYEIYNFARYFIPEDKPANKYPTLKRLYDYSRMNDEEYFPTIYISNSDDTLKERLKKLLMDLTGNTAILLYHTEDVDKYYNIINSFEMECSKWHSKLSKNEEKETEENLKNILITTFISIKGMEVDNVILPEFERADSYIENKRYWANRDGRSENEIKQDIKGVRNQFFIGCTRPKTYLYILAKQLPDIINNDEFFRIAKTLPKINENEEFEDTYKLENIDSPTPETDDLPF